MGIGGSLLLGLGILLSLMFWSTWGGWGRHRDTIVEERRY